MSDISPLSQPNGAGGRLRASRVAAEQPASARPRLGDRVEVSEAARLLARLAERPEVRRDVVDRVRTEIDAGSYESPEKIEQAAESLLDDL